MNNQIHSTKNYDIFKKLDFNRGQKGINPTHLRRLEESILEKNLLATRPIVINEDYLVIDGHHRLEVAKRNNLFIYYVIAPETDYKDAMRLTRGTTNWSLQGYIECRAEHGEEEYQKLLDFVKESNCSIHNIGRLLSGSSRDHRIAQRIKSGKMKFSEKIEELKPYIQKINYLRSLLEKAGVKKERLCAGDFWYGSYLFFKHPQCNWNLFEKRIEKNIYAFSKEYSNWKAVATSLVTIHNHDLKPETRRIKLDEITG